MTAATASRSTPSVVDVRARRCVRYSSRGLRLTPSRLSVILAVSPHRTSRDLLALYCDQYACHLALLNLVEARIDGIDGVTVGHIDLIVHGSPHAAPLERRATCAGNADSYLRLAGFPVGVVDGRSRIDQFNELPILRRTREQHRVRRLQRSRRVPSTALPKIAMASEPLYILAPWSSSSGPSTIVHLSNERRPILVATVSTTQIDSAVTDHLTNGVRASSPGDESRPRSIHQALKFA